MTKDDLFDPFKFDHGLEFAVQYLREDSTQWQLAMEWVTQATAMSNAKKLAGDAFMKAVRCVRLSRYPPWSVQSVHYYWERK